MYLIAPVMTRTTTHEIPGGVQVITPDSLNLVTPYVLYEQRDWFEDEIAFLRRLLQPGQRAIDIGANYGVYTLSIAKAVGPTGAVWAFEPTSSTAAFLAQSIAANHFTQVVLERSALSGECGTAQLTIHNSPNSIPWHGASRLETPARRFRWSLSTTAWNGMVGKHRLRQNRCRGRGGQHYRWRAALLCQLLPLDSLRNQSQLTNCTWTW